MGHLRDSPVPTAPAARLWSRLGTKIPIWDISHLRQFGITFFVHIADQKRLKWEKRGEKGMFLGYDNNSTGYRVFILATFKVIVSDF
jgi:hypothetical protein